LQQARGKFTATRRDLWSSGIISVAGSEGAGGTSKADGHSRAELQTAVHSSDARFVSWLESQTTKKTGPSVVGSRTTIGICATCSSRL
jgi:hypothetical protein